MIQKIKNIYHLLEAVVANIKYEFPSRKIKVIGVTGTDGKTTTTHLIYHILKTANYRVSMVSTVYGKIGEKEYDVGLHTTTPDSFLVQKLLRLAVDHQDEYFVLETTSHALDQNRVWGINYYIGVLTNVTHEHLDYHKTYDEYLKSKLKLLKKSKYSIDQKYYRANLNKIKKIPKLTEFNKDNYAAAYSVAKILKISDETVFRAMLSFKLPPGRLNTVYDKEFKVIVDFAHTPNAFEVALPAIRKLNVKNNGQLIHVFGAAGLRDKTKRLMMGEASNRFSDYIILTEEDYRTEDPKDICHQIAQGIKDKKYEIIIDRELAIKRAISIAKKNDVIVITGKGHEQSLCRGTKEYPWDDTKVVKQALQQMSKPYDQI